jgi:endoglucanase
MEKIVLDRLKMFTDAAAPAGFEHEARELMEKYLKNDVDEMTRDNLGSVITKTVGDEDGPKIMLTSHLDEIGFLVTQVDENGFLRFVNLGGWNPATLIMQQVEVVTSRGERVHGIVGSSSKARGKTPEIKDLYIDLGQTSKEQVEATGIKVGDFVVPYCEFRQMGCSDTILAKAWDNRIGVYVVSEVMKRLNDIKHKNIVYGVGAVQEETGCKGSKTASFKINPDIGIAVDVEFATDFPGGSEKAFSAKIGKGPAITLMDQGTICQPALRDFVIEVAEKAKIDIQINGFAGGGTDASAMHVSRDGAPSITIGVPMRYMHSNTGMLSYSDIEATIKLIVKVVKKLNREKVNEITFF